MKFLNTLRFLGWFLLLINLFTTIGGVIWLAAIGKSDVFLTERFGRWLYQTMIMLYPLGCCFVGFFVNLRATRGSGHSFLNILAIITLNTLLLVGLLYLLMGIDTLNKALIFLGVGIGALLVGKAFQFIRKLAETGSDYDEFEDSENTLDSGITNR